MIAHPAIAGGRRRDSRRELPLSKKPATPAGTITELVNQYHSRRPVRAWSLIITLYGDAIVPRGGSLWLGALGIALLSAGAAWAWWEQERVQVTPDALRQAVRLE